MNKTYYFPNNPVSGFKSDIKTSQTKKDVKTVNSTIKPVIYVSDEVKSKFAYICNKIPNNEWIGFVFYEIIEGSIEELDKLQLVLKDVAPLNIGHSASVMVDLSKDTEKIMEVYDNKPELEEYRRGLIHSHCNMNVFYSGTDTSEIEDNAPLYDMYLSIVVNNRGDICARIGIIGEEEVEYNTTSKIINRFRNSMGQWISQSKNASDSGKKITDVLYIYDLEIESETITAEDEFLIESVEKLLKEKKTVPATYESSYGWNDHMGSWGRDRYNNYGQNYHNKDKTDTKKEEKEKEEDTQTVLEFASTDGKKFFNENRAKEFLSYLINEAHGVNIFTTLHKLSYFKEKGLQTYLGSRIKDKLFEALETFCEFFNLDINNHLEEAFDFLDMTCMEVIDDLNANIYSSVTKKMKAPYYEKVLDVFKILLEEELEKLKQYSDI